MAGAVVVSANQAQQPGQYGYSYAPAAPVDIPQAQAYPVQAFSEPPVIIQDIKPIAAPTAGPRVMCVRVPDTLPNNSLLLVRAPDGTNVQVNNSTFSLF